MKLFDNYPVCLECKKVISWGIYGPKDAVEHIDPFIGRTYIHIKCSRKEQREKYGNRCRKNRRK